MKHTVKDLDHLFENLEHSAHGKLKIIRIHPSIEVHTKSGSNAIIFAAYIDKDHDERFNMLFGCVEPESSRIFEWDFEGRIPDRTVDTAFHLDIKTIEKI